MTSGKKKVVLITTDHDLVDFPPEAWENCEKIVVSAEQFEEFVRLVADDRPPAPAPRLAELFARPSVFDDGESTCSLLPPGLV
jgi:hypothetical protein